MQSYLVSLSHLLVLIVVAGLVTPPPVLWIPRARQSPAFDRLLWVGTYLIAFFGGWLAPAYIGDPFPSVALGGVSLLPIVIGSLAGVLALHLILFFLDWFERPEEDGDDNEG